MTITRNIPGAVRRVRLAAKVAVIETFVIVSLKVWAARPPVHPVPVSQGPGDTGKLQHRRHRQVRRVHGEPVDAAARRVGGDRSGRADLRCGPVDVRTPTGRSDPRGNGRRAGAGCLCEWARQLRSAVLAHADNPGRGLPAPRAHFTVPPRQRRVRVGLSAGVAGIVFVAALAVALAAPAAAHAEIPVIGPVVKTIGGIGHTILHPAEAVVEALVKVLQAIFGGVEAKLITAVVDGLLAIPNFDTGHVAELEHTTVAIAAGHAQRGSHSFDSPLLPRRSQRQRLRRIRGDSGTRQSRRGDRVHHRVARHLHRARAGPEDVRRGAARQRIGAAQRRVAVRRGARRRDRGVCAQRRARTDLRRADRVSSRRSCSSRCCG